jgi:hypothetical protein
LILSWFPQAQREQEDREPGYGHDPEGRSEASHLREASHERGAQKKVVSVRKPPLSPHQHVAGMVGCGIPGHKFLPESGVLILGP